MFSSAARSSLDDLKTRYLKAQITGNRREALRVVVQDGLATGASVLQLQIDVIQAAQRDIGRLWQENQINIAQEHMATAISQLALAQLYDEAQRAPSNGKKVLVSCVEGELHDFPSRMVADALDLAGFQVVHLGADVALSKLLSGLTEQRPDLLALSCTMDFNLPALRTAVPRVREHVGLGLPIVVGGSACNVSDLTSELGVDGTASDVAEAVACAARLVGLA